MSRRAAITAALLAALGIVAAAGIGLLTNAIAGESIGLSSAPLAAGRALAPPHATPGESSGADRSHDRRERHGGGGDDDTTTSAPTTTVPTTTGPTTAVPNTTTGGFESEAGRDD